MTKNNLPIFTALKTHITVWLIFIIYEVAVIIYGVGTLPQFARLFIYYGVNILLFYTNAYLLYKIGNKYWLIPLLIFSEVILHGLIIYAFERTFSSMKILGFESVQIDFNIKNLFRSIWRALYFIGFSTGYVYMIKALEESKHAERLKTENLINSLDNQRLENELVRVENNYLRSQINPHFLFNTLSFIYNGTRKTAPDAASAILSLSDMMRYALKQPASSDTIFITDEIEQVENLINLHKLRTKNNVFVNLKISENLNGVKFLPLMLLTLVENVFKHGNTSDPENPATITVYYEHNKLTISTENLIADKKHGESNSVGMENIRKRLEGYYKGRASLNFYRREPNTYFTIINVENV